MQAAMGSGFASRVRQPSACRAFRRDSSSAMRASRWSSARCTSSASRRSGMCCGQFQSKPSTLITIARCGRARSLGRDEPGRQRRVVGQRLHGHRAEQLQANTLRVVDRNQRHALIACQVADADQLPVAGVVGKGDVLLVEHLHEPNRPAAVLNVGPAGLGHGGHVEAAQPGEEVHLGLAQPIVAGFGIGLEVAGVAGTAAVALLRGFHLRREGDLGKGVGHGGISVDGAELCRRSPPARSRAGAKGLLSFQE